MTLTLGTLRQAALRIFLVLGLTLSSTAIVLVATQEAALADSLGYPDVNASDCSSQFGASSWCKNGTWLSGRSYGYRNCTDYVAWKLESLGVASTKTRNLGNAKEWDEKAAAKSMPVLTSPKAGTVAVSESGTWGHVAYVELVNSDGTITVTEYNADWGGNGRTWTGSPSSRGFTRYVDFGVATSGGGVGPAGLGVRSATFLGSETLLNGQQLRSEQYIVSANVKYALIMQNDGNLVIYGRGYRPVWASNTGGHPGAYLGLQSDGNIVIYYNGIAIWATGSSGSLARLVMQNDGNLVAYSSTWQVMWASNTFFPDYSIESGQRDHMYVGQQLGADWYLRSNDGRHALLMQTDGNLVLYGPGYHILWASGTGSSGGSYLGLQDDGNIVIYYNGSAIWATGSSGSLARLVMQNDGNLVARDTAGNPIWVTGTDGRI